MNNIVQNYIEVIKKYAVFDGRATRTEYWYFFLATFIISIVISIFEKMGGVGNFLGVVYSIATFLPGLGVSIRRLHDTDRSGWWTLLCLLPIIGWLVFLIFMVIDGTSGDNKYGPNPKGTVTSTEPASLPQVPAQ